LGIDAAVARGESPENAQRRANDCAKAFDRRFDDYGRQPERFDRVTIFTLDRWREGFLREYGFHDAFVDLKARENQKMLPLLPVICRELDALSGEAQFMEAVRGIFAGNLFDMGAEATAGAYLHGGPRFSQSRESIKPRPWLIDQYDAFADRMLRGKPGKAVFFVDNAGSDFLLGALPFMRWMCQRGWRVVLAANEQPALNDMTIAEVHALWPQIVDAEPSFGTLPIDRVSSGTGEPLIDLLQVADELNAAAEDADLVILEGMGRGVESNLNAEFTCAALNIAIIKDTAVARRNNGELYDLVLRYR
jgi:type II pantothenate kinase